MQAFDYSRATTIDEATGLLQQAQGRARILAGGTDLLVALRERRLTTDLVIDVKSIAELMALHYDAETGLHIGAAAPCWRIYGDPHVASLYPGLVDAVRQIGGVQIQGRASLGGNLCNASPAADSIPALIVHAAQAEIAGPAGRRKVPVEQFCTGPGRTVLQPGRVAGGAASAAAAAAQRRRLPALHPAQRDGYRRRRRGRLGTARRRRRPLRDAAAWPWRPSRRRRWPCRRPRASWQGSRSPTELSSRQPPWPRPQRGRSPICAGRPSIGATSWAC